MEYKLIATIFKWISKKDQAISQTNASKWFKCDHRLVDGMTVNLMVVFAWEILTAQS